MRHRRLAAALILGLSSGAALAQEETLYRALTPEQLEGALKSSKIEFKKIADKTANTFFYDYQAKNFNLRLHYLGGKQLLLDTLFGALPLEKVNEWNLGPRFSRAGLGKDDKGGAYTVVESRLNLNGGVTQAALKEHLSLFIQELDQFEAFLRASLPRKDEPTEEKAFKEVVPELVEKILGDLKIKAAKAPLTNDAFAYQYQAKETKIVLSNWGPDMMLAAKFPKIPLEKVNQYNLDRKFIRAVSHSSTKGDYTSLEANLSFTGGVTESILRNFISVFEEDVDTFAAYVRKK